MQLNSLLILNNFGDNMLINQVIYTIQCEGLNIGKPSILIRTQGCNLRCPWCDTKQTWNKIDESDQDVINNKIYKYFQKYDNINNIMLTGGEPLFNNFVDIMEYINNHKLLKDIPIEIETNGTLIQNNIELLNKYKDKIVLNISPKLDPSCHSYKQTKQLINDLYSVNMNIAKMINLNYNLKFVYSPTKESKNEILQFIKINQINLNKISVMSLTNNNKTVNINNCKKTIEFCKEYGFRYSPRLHLMIYGDDVNEESI